MPNKTPMELARNVLDYVESRIAKDIGTCQPGTFCANAGVVAAALIERMTPVPPVEVFIRYTSCADTKCGLCGSNGCTWTVTEHEAFCPRCGVPIKWT